MNKITLVKARYFVLRFLLDERCFSPQGKQVTEETVLKHVRRDLGDKEHKAIARAISQLAAQGLVGKKEKHYGTHLWLNRERLDEISQILSQPLPTDEQEER